MYLELGEHKKAIECHQRGLEISRLLGDLKAEGANWINLANVFVFIGQANRAIPLYEDAIKRKQAIGDMLGVAYAASNLGRIHAQRGNYLISFNLAQSALGIFERLNHPQAATIKTLVTTLRKLTR